MRKLVVELFLGELLAVVLFRAELLRDGEEGHDWSMVDTVELHLVEHFAGVGEGFGHIGKHLVHLLARLKPLLLRIEQTVRVVQVLVGCKAE